MYDGYYQPNHPETLQPSRRPASLWRGVGPLELKGIAADHRDRECYVVIALRERRGPGSTGAPYLLASSFLISEERRGDGDDEIAKLDDYRIVAGRPFPFLVTTHGTMGDVIETVLSVEVLESEDRVFAHPTKSPPSKAVASEDPNVASFDAVWSIINDVYYDPSFGGVDWTAAGDRYRTRVAGLAAVGGREFVEIVTQMIAELRSTHYRLVPRDRVKSGESRDTQPGRIGLELRWIEESAVVWALLPGTPAEGSPLRPGFVVTAINGRDDGALHERHAPAIGHEVNPLRKRIVPYAHEMLVQAGEPVTIDYRDGSGDPGQATLTAIEQERQMSPRVEVSTHGSILVIAFKLFFGDLVERFRAALAAHPEARGLVVDLRGNPGGVAQHPVAIAGMLTAEPGSLGRSIYRNHAADFTVTPSAAPFLGPLAILIDSGSGSCSELLAGNLQERGRARVFGRRSAGAVLPSTEILLPNGCLFQYVVCDYTTAGGKRLESVGVIPDDGDIELSRADLLAGRDRDLDAALAWIESR
ncbi:MAG: S41 family peptidase [Acidobacteriota bacterium]